MKRSLEASRFSELMIDRLKFYLEISWSLGVRTALKGECRRTSKPSFQSFWWFSIDVWGLGLSWGNTFLFYCINQNWPLLVYCFIWIDQLLTVQTQIKNFIAHSRLFPVNTSKHKAKSFQLLGLAWTPFAPAHDDSATNVSACHKWPT